MPEEPCTEVGFHTAYEASIAPEVQHLREAPYRCELCEKCGKWHMRAVDEPEPEP